MFPIVQCYCMYARYKYRVRSGCEHWLDLHYVFSCLAYQIFWTIFIPLRSPWNTVVDHKAWKCLLDGSFMKNLIVLTLNIRQLTATITWKLSSCLWAASSLLSRLYSVIAFTNIHYEVVNHILLILPVWIISFKIYNKSNAIYVINIPINTDTEIQWSDTCQFRKRKIFTW